MFICQNLVGLWQAKGFPKLGVSLEVLLGVVDGCFERVRCGTGTPRRAAQPPAQGLDDSSRQEKADRCPSNMTR